MTQYQTPPPAWAGAPRRPTNGMAIASLVLGILWLWWIGSILALVLGYKARRQIDETGEEGRGLATAGIVLGWVGMGMLAVSLLILGIGTAATNDAASDPEDVFGAPVEDELADEEAPIEDDVVDEDFFDTTSVPEFEGGGSWWAGEVLDRGRPDIGSPLRTSPPTGWRSRR